MRALVVTNMWPSPERPALGAFVRDQVEALRRLDGIEVEVFAFAPGAYVRAARELRARHRCGAHDIVHAHFGLSAWVALALPGSAPRAVTLHGTDVRHPRSRAITRAALGRMDLVAAVSEELAAAVPGHHDVRVLPCGIDIQRFNPIPRAAAREELGLPVDQPCLLFPADPARAGKRYDLALEVAGGAPLHALVGIDPLKVPLWINAANAVVLPSEAEGFGLAVLEALACDVPVLATPVGNHPAALDGVTGSLCAPYDRERWGALAAAHLAASDPRVAGRDRAEQWSADRMALRVAAAWRELLGA